MITTGTEASAGTDGLTHGFMLIEGWTTTCKESQRPLQSVHRQYNAVSGCVTAAVQLRLLHRVLDVSTCGRPSLVHERWKGRVTISVFYRNDDVWEYADAGGLCERINYGK